MYSNEKFYKKKNELHEIHFLVRLGSLSEVNAPPPRKNSKPLILMKLKSYVRIFIWDGITIWLLAGKNAESYFKC